MLAAFLNVIMIRSALKHVVIDSVRPEYRCKLASRILLASLAVFLVYSCVKYFPLTYCMAVRNTSPFFTLILSAKTLKEPPTVQQVLILVAVVSLVMAFIFSGPSDEGHDDSLE